MIYLLLLTVKLRNGVNQLIRNDGNGNYMGYASSSQSRSGRNNFVTVTLTRIKAYHHRMKVFSQF